MTTTTETTNFIETTIAALREELRTATNQAARCSVSYPYKTYNEMDDAAAQLNLMEVQKKFNFWVDHPDRVR